MALKSAVFHHKKCYWAQKYFLRFEYYKNNEKKKMLTKSSSSYI